MMKHHEPDFSAAEREAVYRVIESRRDVRAHFTGEAIPRDVLMRILGAAHHAPSVGLSQPWRFIVVQDAATRSAVYAAFTAANSAAATIYEGDRAERYAKLRLEGILDASVNICVTCDDDPARGAGLGRQSIPETAAYSTVCAIQNLWLAARAEGVGVGWVSIIEPAELHRILAIPPHVRIVGYLCAGYVTAFADEPDLVRAGWEARMPLDDVIDFERYGGPR